MRLPPGAQPILDARLRGLKPAAPVVVSFVGFSPFNAPHVHPKPGVAYDWRFLADLVAIVLVRPGIDAARAVADIFGVCNPLAGYPALVDVEREQLAYVVANKPLRLWQVRRNSPEWAEFFPWR